MSIEKGSWSATATSSELIAESDDRGSLVVQLQSGNRVSLGFGEDAVFGEGVQLGTDGDSVEIKGHQARMAINGICDTGGTASGGYQES